MDMALAVIQKIFCEVCRTFALVVVGCSGGGAWRVGVTSRIRCRFKLRGRDVALKCMCHSLCGATKAKSALSP